MTKKQLDRLLVAVGNQSKRQPTLTARLR